jgi:hypothetical protein
MYELLQPKSEVQDPIITGVNMSTLLSQYLFHVWLQEIYSLDTRWRRNVSLIFRKLNAAIGWTALTFILGILGGNIDH